MLAYIRRTQFQTSLIVQDLTTGNEYIVNSTLDFDQQESSAPAGVYPGFVFTPDDSHIILWAKGKIFSINIAAGGSSEIPFTVNVDLQLANTVRYNHPAEDGATFNTKIVTSPSVSGDKKTFAFTTLAATYRMTHFRVCICNPSLVYSTAAGYPTLLNTTLGDGDFQFWPSISQDNNYLV